MFRRFLFSRIWSSAQDYASLGLLLNPIVFWISTWQNLSGGNDLYWRCTSFEKAFRRGRPLNIYMIHRGGRYKIDPSCIVFERTFVVLRQHFSTPSWPLPFRFTRISRKGISDPAKILLAYFFTRLLHRPLTFAALSSKVILVKGMRTFLYHTAHHINGVPYRT